MRRRPLLAAGLLVAALACGACGRSTGSTGSAHGAAPPTGGVMGTPTAGSTPSSTASSSAPTAGAPAASGSDFCAEARRIGLEDVQIEGSGHADLPRMLAGLNTLDGLAPPDLKPDFDRFVGLERNLLDPAHAATGAAGDVNDPDNLTALGHVETYLQNTCGIAQGG